MQSERYRARDSDCSDCSKQAGFWREGVTPVCFGDDSLPPGGKGSRGGGVPEGSPKKRFALVFLALRWSGNSGLSSLSPRWGEKPHAGQGDRLDRSGKGSGVTLPR